MQCSKCRGSYIEKTDPYEFIDPYVGKIIIQGKRYYRCELCNDVLLSPELVDAIEIERKKLKNSLISRYPISDFVSASETALLLRVTRQALNKNQRIKRGFIYHISIGKITLYLRQSVMQYKETGDGRFPLLREVIIPQYQNLESVNRIPAHRYSSFSQNRVKMDFAKLRRTTEGRVYVN